MPNSLTGIEWLSFVQTNVYASAPGCTAVIVIVSNATSLWLASDTLTLIVFGVEK